MIFNSKQRIPEVYARERDTQVFTTLIDILLTASKYDIDNLYRLYDAMECPEIFLPELGNTVNFSYDNANTVTSNRKILSIFMTMMKYKGSEIGLLMATALCLTSLDLSRKNLESANVDIDYINALKSLEIRYNYEKAEITIDYPNIYTQVRYLLDYVRPVGMTLKIRSVVNTKQHIPMAILAQIVSDIKEYNTHDSDVNSAKVNFSYPVDDVQLSNWKNILYDLNENDANITHTTGTHEIDLNN